MGAKTSSEYLEWESFINRDLPLLLNSQKDYFTVEDVLNFQPNCRIKFNFKTIGMLFALDENYDGKFYVSNFSNMLNYMSVKFEKCHHTFFEKIVQSQCLIEMNSSIEINGIEFVSNWIMQCIKLCYAPSRGFFPNDSFVLLCRIFGVEKPPKIPDSLKIGGITNEISIEVFKEAIKEYLFGLSSIVSALRDIS